MFSLNLKHLGSLLILLLSSSLSVAETPKLNTAKKVTQDLELLKFQNKIKSAFPKDLKMYNMNVLESDEIKERLESQPNKREGGITDGGGNATSDGDLFDFYENKGTVPLVFSNFESFKNKVAPLLLQLEKSIPGLGEKLGSYLSSKKWYLEPKPLSNKKCENVSFLQIETAEKANEATNERKKIVVACQDEFEVRIYTSWFTERKDGDQALLQLNQAGLITHELLVGFLMDLGFYSPELKDGAERSVRVLNRELYTAPFNSQNFLEEVNRRLKLEFKSAHVLQQEAANAAALKAAKVNLANEEINVLHQLQQMICAQEARNFSAAENLIRQFYPYEAAERKKILFSPQLANLMDLDRTNISLFHFIPDPSMKKTRAGVCYNIKTAIRRIQLDELSP
ncbi:MAG: hypothetical protein AB7O96_05380 [Pseudobdellovibrionaceae bacterium]